MNKRKLPLKFQVFQCVANASEPISANEIMELLRGDYGKERQFTKKRVELYLTALSCVSMIREVDVTFDSDGTLLVSYEISQLGKSRLKYLPNHQI